MKYDGAEIGICVNYIDPRDSEEFSERMEISPEEAQAMVNDPNDEAESWVWSVYWHLAEGGAEWVADFSPACKDEATRLHDAMMCAAFLSQGRDEQARAYANSAVRSTT